MSKSKAIILHISNMLLSTDYIGQLHLASKLLDTIPVMVHSSHFGSR